MDASPVRLACLAAKKGVDVISKIWTLIDNNRPSFDLQAEIGEGVHVLPEGVAPNDVVPYPEIQLQRLKDHTYRKFVTLIDANTCASWYCAPHAGGLYIKDAILASDVKRVWPANKLTVTVRFRSPEVTSRSGFVVAYQPLVITSDHRNPFNVRTEPTFGSIYGDGELEIDPKGFSGDDLMAWLSAQHGSTAADVPHADSENSAVTPTLTSEEPRDDARTRPTKRRKGKE